MSMTLNHDNYELISTRSFLYVTVVQSKHLRELVSVLNNLGMRTINELRKSRIARTERPKKAFTKKIEGSVIHKFYKIS